MKTHWTFRKATITIFSENSFNVLMLTMKLVNEVLLTIATVLFWNVQNYLSQICDYAFLFSFSYLVCIIGTVKLVCLGKVAKATTALLQLRKSKMLCRQMVFFINEPQQQVASDSTVAQKLNKS